MHDNVWSSSGRSLPRDSIEYVDIIGDNGEEFLVSEHDEDDNLHESCDNLYDKSDKFYKGVDEDGHITISYLHQSFSNLQAAENLIRAYVLKNWFTIKIQHIKSILMIIQYMLRRLFVI